MSVSTHPASMLETIELAASRYREREAVVEFVLDSSTHRYRRTRAVSYGQLVTRAKQMANLWAKHGNKHGNKHGAEPGARIAVLLDNGADMVASEWSCLISGWVWVALNARSSATENAAILKDAGPSIVLISKQHRDQLGSELPPGCRVFEINEEFERSLSAVGGELDLPSPSPTAPVRIRYTSGTAGKPKGAVLSRGGYDASLESVAAVLGPLSAHDAVVQAAPMTHASGAMFGPHACVGARALALDRFDAEAFIALVEMEEATATFLVPTMLARVLDLLVAPGRMPTLRSIVYGGAALPVDRLERGLELLGEVFIGIYGLTESTWPVTALLREDHLPASGSAAHTRARLASCGRTTETCELRIVDANQRDVSVGRVGEIWVRGRNTMLGYWDATNAAPADRKSNDLKGLDENGWMHTGDVGKLDTDGFLTIVDRLHDMIVSGGFNVYPREVEDALSAHPAVLESAVVGRPHPQWGESVHACVVVRPGAHVDEAELAAHCAHLTADYKKPRSFEFLADLPRNASGKVLRRALRGDS
ncbi:MAG: acyl-CoA synthetase (AMP-forming)/AMP-acid ligase II [Candidatus Binatia bacterium]